MKNRVTQKISFNTGSMKLTFIAFSSLLIWLSINAPNLSSTDGWNAGFAHPLEGWDHIVTMIAVGIWAAQLRGHAVWLLPLAFVGVMSLGGIAGAAGILLPAVESIILLSCAVFSLFIIRRIKFSNRINLVIVAFFAFFHGFAHGQEISTSASLISYSVGFMLATLLLHGIGIFATKLVLFCLTCFLAILLPSLAQAAQSKTISNINENTDPVIRLVNFDGNSPWREMISHANSGSDHFFADDFNATFKSLCAVIPDNPDPGKPTLKQRMQLTSPVPISKTERLGKASTPLSLINKINFAALSTLPPYFALISQDSSPNIAANFKHYYPDINYTPGQSLLSNGVGATSPPLIVVTRIALSVRTTRFHPVSRISSVADQALHSKLVDISLSFSPLISTDAPIDLTSAHRLHRIVDLANKATSDFSPEPFYDLYFKGCSCAFGEILQPHYTT